MATGLVAERRTQISADPAMARTQIRAAIETEKRRVIAQQSARSGGIAPQLAAVWVDGTRNGSLENIRPNGVVILDWSYLREAVEVTLDYLRTTGPIESGEWRNSLDVLIGGQSTVPAAIPATAKEATVTTTVPYARVLEVVQGFALDVDTHYVQHAATLLNRKHRSLAKFDFTYLRLTDSYVLKAPIRRSARTRETTTAQPAIHIVENPL